MKLSETVDLMNSEEYGDRLIAEYLQACIRHERLLTYLGPVSFTELSSLENDRLITQLNIMSSYICILATRLKALDLYSKACEIWEDLDEKKQNGCKTSFVGT